MEMDLDVGMEVNADVDMDGVMDVDIEMNLDMYIDTNLCRIAFWAVSAREISTVDWKMIADPSGIC